jgi:tetratricopeptide (TPR) repeat protein
MKFPIPWFAAFFLWLFATTILAGESRSFERAHKLALSGDHIHAVQEYRGLLSEQGPSFSVLYNLGGSYAALGDHGNAMLCYERARLISPRDPDLLRNIDLTRKAAKIPAIDSTKPPFQVVLHFFSRNELSLGIMVLAGLILLMSLFAFLLRPPRRGLRPVLFGCSTVALLLSVLSAYAISVRKSEDDLAVILAKNCSLRLSPFAKADVMTTCEAGRMVLIESVRGDFSYVHLVDTELRGWVVNGELERIIPAG